MKRKILIGLAVVFLATLVSAFVLFQVTFGPLAPPPDAPIALPASDVLVVPDGHVMTFLVDVGGGRAVLVDCGNDTEAKAIKAVLAEKKWTLDAILVTHGHVDHVSGCSALSSPASAGVHALAAEVPYVEGTKAHAGPVPAIAGAHGRDVKVARAVNDGDVLTFGNKTFTVHAVPGHTPGSAVYVESGGVAFFGDVAALGKDGTILGPPWIFSDDVAQGVASLHALARRLRNEATTKVVTFAFSHSAAMTPADIDALERVQ